MLVLVTLASTMLHSPSQPLFNLHSRSPALRMSMTSTPAQVASEVSAAKSAFFAAMREHEGDVSAPAVAETIEVLNGFPKPSQKDVMALGDGLWYGVSRENFPGGLGQDEQGRNVYTLGRCSFNMFQPLDLEVSLLEGRQNRVQLLDDSTHSFNNYIPFETRSGMSGMLTVSGNVELDPKVRARMKVRFTGGEIRPGPGTPISEWNSVFEEQNMRGMSTGQKLTQWIAKIAFGLIRPTGADPEGVVSYEMTKAPKGYLDVLFLDEDLRITRGNRGTIVVATRAAHHF